MTALAPATGSRRGPTALGVGVVVWLASELMFFAGLFATWFTQRAISPEWPPPGVELATGRTLGATAVLLASSVTMHAAAGAAKRSDRTGVARWLAVTAALGVLFLANTVAEWHGDGFGIDSHPFGSIFYVLTGFHALHVAGGVAFMGASAAIVQGRSRAPVASTIEACAAYWHFVDAVWVAVFLTVYVLR
jgi:cytochrome c oxidase subunit 3